MVSWARAPGSCLHPQSPGIEQPVLHSLALWSSVSRGVVLYLCVASGIEV